MQAASCGSATQFVLGEPPIQTASSCLVLANVAASSAKFGIFVAWTKRSREPANVSPGMDEMFMPSRKRFSKNFKPARFGTEPRGEQVL